VAGLTKRVRVTEVSVNSLGQMVSFPLNNAIVLWMNLVRLAVWTGNNLERCRLKKKVTVWAILPFFI
jgi:hypothetical protein